MKYFKPKSMTWWSGLVLAALPLLKVLGVELPAEVGDTLTQVATGTGLVGLRGAASKLLQG